MMKHLLMSREDSNLSAAKAARCPCVPVTEAVTAAGRAAAGREAPHAISDILAQTPNRTVVTRQPQTNPNREALLKRLAGHLQLAKDRKGPEELR